MLSLPLPFIVTLVQLLTAPDAPVAPAHSGPRLELTARGLDARELAAEVVIDADAIADVVALDGGVVLELELAGERHELRLETGAGGRVVGAALWWLGPTAIADDDAPAAGGADAWDFDPAIAALMEAGTLDRLQVRAGAVELDAAGVDFTLGPVEDHAHEVDDGYDEPGC